MTRRIKPGQEGSALILALFFSVIFFVLLAAVMAFTDVGLKSVKAFQSQLASGSASAGAMDAAINKYRIDNGSVCADGPAPMTPDVRPVGGRNVIVHCASAHATNRPANALLGLGAEGIVSTSPGVHVKGDVFSNSTIDATAPNGLHVEGRVAALGTCTGDIVPACPAPSTVDPLNGRDPDFTKATDTVPVRRSVPACPSAPAWLVTLHPGYYDDAAGLSALTNGGCPDAVVWLEPGVYYLDLGFTTGTDGVWTINDNTTNVVGGTPRDWDPTAAARATVPAPGGCKTEADRQPVSGIQMIIGGKSRIEVDNGAKVELCAEPSSTDQQLALYGLSPDHPDHTLEPTVATAVDGFRDARNALVIGESPAATAVAQLAPSGPESASLTLAGFQPLPPDNALIDEVHLHVVHQDSQTGGGAAARVSFTGIGNTCSQDLALRPGGGLDQIDLIAACGIITPAQLAALGVTYTAVAGSSVAGDELDGLSIEVSYRTPTTRKPTAIQNASSDFATPENALEIGESPASYASASLTSPTATSASMTLAGYGNPRIPDGSTITSAVLRVAHREDGDIGTGGVKVSVGFGGSTCTDLPVALRAGALGVDRIPLNGCGLDTATDLDGLTVTYQVDLKSGGSSATDTLDGILLDLTYQLPSIRYSPEHAASAVFTTPDNAKAIDGANTSDAVLGDGGPATSASLAVDDFHLPTVPLGSVVDSAVLRVAHQDLGDAGPATMTATFPGHTCSSTVAPRPTAIGEDLLDLRAPACGFTDVSALPDLSVTYDVVLPGAGTATHKVDGIVLDLAYRPPSTYEPTEVPAVAGFVNGDKAKVIDGDSSEAQLSGSATASLTVSGFGQVPLPPGSVVDKAELRVAHAHTGDGGTATVTTSVGGICSTSSVPLASGEDRFDVTSCLTDPSKLASLSTTYDVSIPSGAATFDLDGVALDIVFRPPSFEPLAGCLLQTYPGPGCAVVKTGSTGGTRLVAQGTIYTPTAALDISMTGVSAPVLTRGLVARTIRLGVSVASGYTGATTAVPPPTVEFTAYPAAEPTTREPANAAATGFSNANNTKHVDGSDVAEALLTDSGPATATLSVDDFHLPSVAPGSTIDSAVLRVVHREAGDGGSATLTATVPSAPLAACARTVPDHVTMGEDRLDVRACGLTDAGTLGDLHVTYDAALAPGGTSRSVQVDGIVLDLAYREPVTQRPVTVVGTGFGSNADMAKATTIDGDTSDAGLDATGAPASASLTVSDFDAPPVAAGSIDSATLRVAHLDDPGIVPSLTVAFEGNTLTTPQTLDQKTGSIGEQDFNLRRDFGLTDTAALAGLSVTYDVALASGTATEHLDGIELDVTLLTGAKLRAQVEFDPDSNQLVVKGWSVLH